MNTTDFSQTENLNTTQIPQGNKYPSLLIGFLLFLVVILIAFSAYLFLQVRSLQKVARDTDQSVGQLPVSVPTTPDTVVDNTTIAQNTKNLKKYDDTEFNLSFYYPSYIQSIEKIHAEAPVITLLLSMGKQSEDVLGGNGFIAPVEMYIGYIKDRGDFYFGGYNWTSDIISDIKTRKIGEKYVFTKEERTYQNSFTVDGITAYEYTAQPMESTAYTAVVFTKGTNSYLITFHPNMEMTYEEFTEFVRSIDFAE